MVRNTKLEKLGSTSCRPDLASRCFKLRRALGCCSHVNFVQRLYPTLNVYQKKKKVATFNLELPAWPFFATPVDAADEDSGGAADFGDGGDTAADRGPSVATIRACAILVLEPVLLLVMWHLPPLHLCCTRRAGQAFVEKPLAPPRQDTRAYVVRSKVHRLRLTAVLLWLRFPLSSTTTASSTPRAILRRLVCWYAVTQKRETGFADHLLLLRSRCRQGGIGVYPIKRDSICEDS